MKEGEGKSGLQVMRGERRTERKGEVGRGYRGGKE